MFEQIIKRNTNSLGNSETRLKCWSKFVSVLDVMSFEMDIDHANLAVIILVIILEVG